MFYNSKDGGQTNVPVEILETIPFGAHTLYVIVGKDLGSETIVDGQGVLVVSWDTLSANPTATVTQLHR